MLETILSIAAPLVGGLLSSSSNSSAADTAANASLESARLQIEANERARKEFREAAARGIGAIRAGTGNYAATINPLLTPNPVALPTHRGLTAGQQIAHDDLMRDGRATLAASGLRGAGRAGVGTILDASRRFRANAADTNDRETRGEMRRAQGVADNARSGLAQVYAQEGGAIANTEIGAGNRIGESMTADGRAAGGAAADAGQYQAQATTANGNVWGDAIGALGSVIADASKNGNWDKYRATGGSI